MTSQRVQLNVGGQLFETTKSTLMSIDYFRVLLTHSKESQSKKPIFIDRSPHIFKHVLSLIRDPYYPYPLKYINELDHYGIELSESSSLSEGLPSD